MGKKFRIAFFSDAPFIGGAEKYIYLLATGLKREHFEPALVMNSGPALETLREWMTGAGIETHEVSLNLPHSLEGTGGFVRLLRSLKPDLFHMNLPGPYSAQHSLVAPLARFAGVRRIVTTEHLPMWPSFRKGRILKSLGTRWVDRVITVSNDNRKHLVSAHGVAPGKIRVVYIGIPDPGSGSGAGTREELGLERNDVLLAIVGALDGRKGHETAFKAIKRLPGKFHLVVVGEGDRENDYRRIVTGLGIRERVHFLGQRDGVSSILRDVDLLVHPSSIDATPYVIIEAMAAGLPVIASGIYGIPELVSSGVTGLLIESGNDKALYAGVTGLFSDGDRLEKMGIEARERYKSRFMIEQCVTKTIEVYGELLPRKNGGVS